MNNPAHGKLLGIQFCRGIAAIIVVLYHAGRMLALPQYAGRVALGGLFNFGNAGVDFFFVLSGFIIFFVHEKDIGQTRRLPAYIWSRVTRIYPIYWLVTVIVLCLILMRPARTALDPGYVIFSFLLLPQTQDPVLGAGWTLVHEMLFYFVFATVIVSRVAGFSIALVWLVVSTIGGFFTFAGTVGVVASSFHLQFAMGVAAAYAVRYASATAAFAITGAGIVGSSALALALIANPGFYFTVECRCLLGLTCAAIICGVAQLELDGKLRIGRLGAFLGSASYSIYLIHTVVIGLFAKALIPTHVMAAAPGLALILVSSLAVGAGSVLFVVAEQPMLRFAKARAPGRNALERT